MLKKFLEKSWPIISITVVVFVFHSRLFIPEPSIYITPDYGRSDSWHLSIANKFYYAQELKQNRIPIWNPYIGTGFPTLAEGQTAIFFLPNLIFFRFLPLVWAYNLTLVLSFLIAGWGIYFFSRSLGLSKLASTYAGTIFPLGGFFVLHVQHHNLLQTASLLPWLFWTTNEFLRTRKVLFLFFLSLSVSQQIFAGFPQLTFYSLVGLFVYIFLRLYFDRLKKIKYLVLFSSATALGFIFSAIQLIPTYEFLNISTKISDPQNILTEFPYTYKNLLQFFDPYVLGTPKDGSYQHWLPGLWGIFWESSAYVGKIPLVLGLSLALIMFFKKVKQKNEILIFSSLIFVSLLFALGEFSPLRIIYSIPPFSIFRVPSRFLMLTQFSLVLMAAIYLNKIKSKPIAILIVFFSVADLFINFNNYNPVGRYRIWEEKTPTTSYLNENGYTRIITLGKLKSWNEYFFKGWDNEESIDYFYFSRNALDQNSNLIFNISQFSAYESMSTRRTAAKNSLIDFKISGDSLILSKDSLKLLEASSVSHIITPKKILRSDLELKKTVTNGKESFFLYKLNKPSEKIYAVDNVRTKIGKNQIMSSISDDQFDFRKSAIIENEINLNDPENLQYKIDLISENPNKRSLKVNVNKEALLILNESYYPGWQVSIDSKKGEIIPVNINSMGTVIREGTHLVEFSYKPKSFFWGTVISLLAYFLAFLVILKFNNYKVSSLSISRFLPHKP